MRLPWWLPGGYLVDSRFFCSVLVKGHCPHSYATTSFQTRYFDLLNHIFNPKGKTLNVHKRKESFNKEAYLTRYPMFHLVNNYDRYGDYWECLYMYIGKLHPLQR